MSCTCNEKPWFPFKVRAKVGEFERIISFKPGFICEVEGPRSHGRHGVEMLWTLVGEKGAVQFLFFTGWEPDYEYPSQDKTDWSMPADLGYHSPRPMYEDQVSNGTDCPFLPPGSTCYYDGSGLNAIEAWKVFVREGEEALWEHLTHYYRSVFSN